MKKSMIKNQKGFSLLELLIAVAIFTIVMTALFSFMTAISKQYSKNNNEINIQNEAQTLMAHLQDLIIGANSNIGVSGNKIFMINDTTGTTDTDPILFHVIEYDNTKNYLYYYSSKQLGLTDAEKLAYKNCSTREDKFTNAVTLVATHSIAATTAKVETYLMTEYVSEFLISPNIESNYIAINLTLNKDNVMYSAAKNIFLRNKLYDDDTLGVSSGNGGSGGASTPTSASSGSGSGDATENQTTASSIIKETDPTTTAADPDEVKPSKITVAYSGGIKHYGETLNKSEFTVTLEYTDGNKINVSNWTTEDSLYLTSTSGSQKITIDYPGVSSVDCSVTVLNLTGIQVVYNGGKRSIGDTIEQSFFTVYNVYSNGSKELTNDWSSTDIGKSITQETTSVTIYSSINKAITASQIISTVDDLITLTFTQTVNAQQYDQYVLGTWEWVGWYEGDTKYKDMFSFDISGSASKGQNMTITVKITGPSELTRWNAQIKVYYYQDPWNTNAACHINISR